MANITKEYFDQKLDEKFREHTEAILAVVKQGFDETSERLDKLEESLSTL